MWSVIRLILVLSRGHASAERCFSINEDILLPNMKVQTLYAIKFVSDAIHFQNIQPLEFKVSNGLLQYCMSVRF